MRFSKLGFVINELTPMGLQFDSQCRIKLHKFDPASSYERKAPGKPPKQAVLPKSLSQLESWPSTTVMP